MISINDLYFGYTKNTPLFSNLNLDLPSGKIYGLLGRNGSGKTTLLKNILGLKFPTEGSIEVMGHQPKRRNLKFLQDVFLLAEEIYTPASTIKTFVDSHRVFYPKYSDTDFIKFMNEFDLPHKGHFNRMSMGQKKKVMIAFALACNTKLLVMDEPTNGLDIPSKKQFRKILSHIITTDRLFIMSTHQIRDLHSLIDSVVILDSGKVIFHHDIIDIEDKLNFVVTRKEPREGEFQYYERVPGGYFCIKPKDEDESLEVDIEVLFNAIVSTPYLFDNQFN